MTWLRPDAFAALDDAALVEVIRGACVEALRRGETVAARAREAILTEAERTALRLAVQAQIGAELRDAEAERFARETAREARARAEREAVEQERRAAEEKERRLWALRKGTALAVQTALPDRDGLHVSAWVGPGGERRIYLNGEGRVEFAAYFVTGNRRHPPGSIEVWSPLRGQRDEFVALCRTIAARWTNVRIDCNQAAAWEGEAMPLVPDKAAGDAP